MMSLHSMMVTIHGDTGGKDQIAGAKDRLEMEVAVGTGDDNAHHLAKITVERYTEPNGDTIFNLWFDDLRIHQARYDDNWELVE